MSFDANIESIIQRQVASWEVRRRIADVGGKSARRALAHLSEGPWIAVSRQWGSGGVDLARRLARRLEWQVFDREILSEIARHTDSIETVLSRLDERAMGGFNDYIAQILNPNAPGQIAYLNEVVRVVWGIARQGNAVILGRGANWFLNPRFGLRLRIVAPLARRIAAVAELERVETGVAASRVAEHDARQAAFIRQAYEQDIGDALGYDVVLNLGQLDVGAAEEVALEALRCKLDSSS